MEQKIYKIRPEVIKDGSEKRLEWQAEETLSAPRSPEISLALTIIALGLLFFGIITKNYLFVVIIVLVGFILYMQRQKGIQSLFFAVEKDGVEINGKPYRYDSFQSFWIFGKEHEHGQELALRSERRFSPLFLIPIPHSIDANRLRELMLEHLPEKVEKESLVDLLRKAYF
ncbi:hypothetical protein A2608_03365 [Candidatus Azambacteria bacterium RIFOXYD1_FULL_44_10]|nr:MAG: hypothetical protein A2608_03365 [Candidatus Azambacteria bacterium RIFOXYD1_FULL_44_10]